MLTDRQIRALRSVKDKMLSDGGGLYIRVSPTGSQMRAACPACGGDDRTLVITPAKAVFYCFRASKGGDLIGLAAHVRDCSVKEAAEFLAGETVTRNVTVTPTVTPTVNSNAAPEPRLTKEDAALAKIAARLDPEHPVLAKLGLSTATAEKLGIGVDNRGVMRGRLCLPLYEDGQLVGFLGLSLDPLPDVKLPKNLVEPPSAQVIPITKAG